MLSIHADLDGRIQAAIETYLSKAGSTTEVQLEIYHALEEARQKIKEENYSDPNRQAQQPQQSPPDHQNTAFNELQVRIQTLVDSYVVTRGPAYTLRVNARKTLEEAQNKLDLGQERNLKRLDQHSLPSQRHDSQTEGLSRDPTNPASFARVAPPIDNKFDTLEVLHREGFSRWLSGAVLPPKIAVLSRDGSPTFGRNIPFIIVEKLPAEHYGGTSTFFDLGLYKGVLSHCPVPGGWQFCPYRHWAPEPMEMRWMDQKWLHRNKGRLARCPLPPDSSEVLYQGVERVDCTWRSFGSVVEPNTGERYGGRRRRGLGEILGGEEGG